MTKPKHSNQNDLYSLTQQDCSTLCKLQVPVAEDEFDRLRILRQTELLDSSTSDPEFDRYTYLAKRLFKVPIALVSLVDIDRQWFKSRIGLDAQETHRNLAFCSYTVLPYNPEVFVVKNALKDPRFKDNVLVTSHPHIRFYAGAALIVAGIRVGSLCVIDTVPREDFTLDDKATLLDLGHSVSNLIKEKRERILYHQHTNANLILNVRHNIRTPLMSAQVSCSLLQDDQHGIVNLLKAVSTSSGSSGIITKTPSMSTLASGKTSSGYNSMNSSPGPGLATANPTQLIKNYTESLDELDSSLRKIQDFTESAIVFKEINLNPDTEYVKLAYNNLDSFSLSELNQKFNIHTLLHDINECFTNRSLNPNHVFLHKCETKWYVSHDNADENLCLAGDISNMKEAVVTAMNILSDVFVKLNVSLQYNVCCDDEDYQTDMNTLYLKNKSSKQVVMGSLIASLSTAASEVAPAKRVSDNGKNDVEIKGDFIVKVRVSEICMDSINNQLAMFAASEASSRKLHSTKAGSNNNLISVFPDENASDKQKLEYAISHTISKLEKFLIPFDGRFKLCVMNEELSVLEFIGTFDFTSVINKSSTVKMVRCVNNAEGITQEAKMDLVDATIATKSPSSAALCTADDHVELTEADSPTFSSRHRLSKANLIASSKHRDSMLSPSGSSKALQEHENQSSVESHAEYKQRVNGDQLTSQDDNCDGSYHNKIAAVAAEAKTCMRSQTAGSYFSGLTNNHQKLRVLVIEDSLSIQRVMRRLLECKGCEVHSAMNGKIGLECMMKDKYDLAFMDFLMPVMSGLEMLQECFELRASNSSPSGKRLMISHPFDLNHNIVICGMSATASSDEVTQAKKLGMHMFEPKPLGKCTIDSIIDSFKQQSAGFRRNDSKAEMGTRSQLHVS